MIDASPTESAAWEGSSSSSYEVLGVELEEREPLIDWLDDGLRGGRRGRLEAEYPVSLCAATVAAHRVVYEDDKPLSHAMYHVVDVMAPGRCRVGMIGLVYTDPVARGRGLAGLCIESCCEAIELAGGTMALLWSDKPAFYARLGFRPFGEERRWIVNADVCRNARRVLGERATDPDLMLDMARADDWANLEKLYGRKQFRVERESGALETLAAAPETLCAVARRAGRAVAYAALGRGDDFQGVVHEWAGPTRDVLYCLEGLCLEYGPLVVHAGPAPSPIWAALESSGAQSTLDSFALARVLDPSNPPPSSFYLWGFDSI